MNEFLIALMGGIVGAGGTAAFSYFMFFKEQQISRFVSIVDEIDTALVLNERRALFNEGTLEHAEITNDIELNLNKAFSKSMVFLNDKSFRRVANVLDGKFDKIGRNDIYYHFRKAIYWRTKVTLDEVKTKYIKV